MARLTSFLTLTLTLPPELRMTSFKSIHFYSKYINCTSTIVIRLPKPKLVLGTFYASIIVLGNPLLAETISASSQPSERCMTSFECTNSHVIPSVYLNKRDSAT